MRNRATTPLTKAKIRQSWNKYNLYNLSRYIIPSYRSKTFFQQKWKAKSALRDYHGEQVREGQWKRMFKKTLRSVVPMDPAYLAINDGSLESAGRGSGLKRGDKISNKEKQPIPFMSMTFAPLERRLDTAIFRAMFASSTRQARQFVVHGGVKVNGQKMQYPGYLLNPGDMFQVDPERVMYATGAPKSATQVAATEEAEEQSDDIETQTETDPGVESEAHDIVDDIDIERDPKVVLKDLLSQAKSVLSSPREKLGAKKKQDLRAFSSAVKRMLSRSSSATILTDSLEAQFQEIQNQLRIQRQSKKLASQPAEQKDVQTKDGESAPEQSLEKSAELDESTQISDADYKQLFDALTHMQDNPIDESKPYATPWVPRDYMSAFAFIPRYLEVNQNVCAAVYLRHPVARPGLAEVPTPFSESLNSTAFTWYLRRR